MRNKWLIALASLGLHGSVGSVYSYSLLVNPIIDFCGFGLTATTFIFSVAIFFLGFAASRWGIYVDKIGPKKMGLIASILLIVGMLGSAYAIYVHSIVLLYIFYGVCFGTSVGLAYISPVSTLAKYFPDKLAFSAGICIAGFGGGAILCSPLMNYLITSYGLINNFIILAMLYGIIMIASSLYLAPPKDSIVKELMKDELDITPKEVCDTWQFKALFITFMVNISCGIAILALISPMLQSDFGFDAVRAMSFVAFVGMANMTGRFIWATASDVLTRPNTYVIFALLGAIMYWSIAITGNLFIFELCVTVVISMYGGFFSCMPVFLGDIFGHRYLSTIHGKVLYAWSWAGLIGPTLLALCKELSGSYTPMLYVFVLAMLFNLIILWKLRTYIVKGGSIIDDIRRS